MAQGACASTERISKEGIRLFHLSTTVPPNDGMAPPADQQRLVLCNNPRQCRNTSDRMPSQLMPNNQHTGATKPMPRPAIPQSQPPSYECHPARQGSLITSHQKHNACLQSDRGGKPYPPDVRLRRPFTSSERDATQSPDHLATFCF